MAKPTVAKYRKAGHSSLVSETIVRAEKLSNHASSRATRREAHAILKGLKSRTMNVPKAQVLLKNLERRPRAK